MTQDDKKLLLRDLSTRLPYGIKVNSTAIEGYIEGFVGEMAFYSIKREQIGLLTEYGELVVNLSCDIVKPYLRPMSSMTEEEKREYFSFIGGKRPFDCDFSAYPIEYKFIYEHDINSYIDYLNKHHFDYRGLIEKGLALEAPEGMYK